MSDVWSTSPAPTRRVNSWDADYAPSQPASSASQKATNPLKLKFSRTELIASIQSTIDAANAKYTEACEKVDANLKTAKKFVKDNAEVIAKNFNYKTTELFLDSPSFDATVNDVAAQIGFQVNKPPKPNTTLAQQQVALLTLADNEDIEIEEGHPFLLHLSQKV